MSVKVMSAVFDRYPVGGGEMLLALALADVSRDDGVLMLNDSVAELARKTRQTQRGVQLQLRRMQAMGWLQLVKSCDGGRGRCTVYRIARAWIDGAPLVAETGAPDGSPAATNPEPRSGFPGTETPNHVQGFEGRNPERGSPSINTNVLIDTPLPPEGAKELSKPINPTGLDTEREAERTDRKGLTTLKAWLEACATAGEKPIPADDPVFAYCDQAGIGRDVLVLHWAEFRARRLLSTKRQRDWRQTFRNSVRDNWFRLWFLQPGQPATLTTVGLQALAVQQAKQGAPA